MTNSNFALPKRNLLKALAARRIATVEINYDGEGDSGQIQDIVAVDAGNAHVPLDRPVTMALSEGNEPTRYQSLSEAIDDFAWTVLQEYHGGFENDSGGCGTIVIDVAKGIVTLDHNDRYTDVINTTTEV
jgi:hypothetical protein